MKGELDMLVLHFEFCIYILQWGWTFSLFPSILSLAELGINAGFNIKWILRAFFIYHGQD